MQNISSNYTDSKHTSLVVDGFLSEGKRHSPRPPGNVRREGSGHFPLAPIRSTLSKHEADKHRKGVGPLC